ncbi:unnamed protein product [Caenorhabditis brenneri]
MLPLVHLPDPVLDVLLDKLDYISAQSLRKVCHRFRNLIDQQKPKNFKRALEKVLITVGDFSVKFQFSCENEEITVNYQNEEDGCSVNACRKKELENPTLHEKSLKNENYLDTFYNDFILFLKFYNREISDLVIKFETNNIELLEKFPKVSNLKTEFLCLERFDQYQLMTVLPPIEASQIYIDCFNIEENVEYEEFMELDTWKNGRELRLRNGYSTAPLQNFIHFKKVDILRREVTAADLLFLKETFLRDPTLEFYKIGFRVMNPSNLLEQVFGHPLVFTARFRMNRKMWFFRLQDRSKVLVIRLFTEWFDLERVDVTTIPQSAVVQY